MKAKEFESKPRNFVAKNAKMGGAGQHKDKKKAEKQGDLKHKKQLVPMETIEQRLARKIQETVLQGKDDLIAKRKALQDLERNPNVDQQAVQQRKLDLEKEARTKGMTEESNPEYDDEAGMADNNLSTLRRAVDGLDDLINAGDNLPEWCQEKIAVAKSMLVAVWDYMESEEQGVEEGNTGELERLQADVWDFYKDVHNMRPRQWSQEQWNDENFLRLQMKQLSDIVNNMSPDEKAEQGWV